MLPQQSSHAAARCVALASPPPPPCVCTSHCVSCGYPPDVALVPRVDAARTVWCIYFVVSKSDPPSLHRCSTRAMPASAPRLDAAHSCTDPEVAALASRMESSLHLHPGAAKFVAEGYLLVDKPDPRTYVTQQGWVTLKEVEKARETLVGWSKKSKAFVGIINTSLDEWLRHHDDAVMRVVAGREGGVGRSVDRNAPPAIRLLQARLDAAIEAGHGDQASHRPGRWQVCSRHDKTPTPLSPK